MTMITVTGNKCAAKTFQQETRGTKKCKSLEQNAKPGEPRGVKQEYKFSKKEDEAAPFHY